jgi:pSer/pThr/pTyr-binding forkhead associated (FHA) protein
VECVAGFGGKTKQTAARAAAEASRAETEVVDPRSAKTELIEAPPAATRPASARSAASDGSSVHPFRLAGTPTVRLTRERTGEELVASGQRIVIGRDPEAAQILIRSDDERHVSGRHAEIAFFADGRAVVRDLGSRNGTWLNDIRLKAEAPLEVGDKLVLGNAPTVLVVAALEI